MSESIEAVRKLFKQKTSVRINGNDVLFTKGVLESLIQLLLKSVKPKQKDFLGFVDMRSSIEENKDLQMVKKVLSATFLLFLFFWSK